MKTSASFRIAPRLATILSQTYRSSENALKELVDNAWDADAENVNIVLPSIDEPSPIVISDDGSGMTRLEVEQEYLLIADNRRVRRGEVSPQKKRKVKGRKGIGKFAGLVAADVMTLETRARGILTRLVISKSDLLAAETDLDSIELPLAVEDCDPETSGTRIVLDGLNQSLIYPNPGKLKQLLVVDYQREDDFVIGINGDRLAVGDLPGAKVETAVSTPHGKAKISIVVGEKKLPVRKAGIAIRVEGKIVGEPQFFGLEDDESVPKKLLDRVYGEVEADFLLESDSVTADWGSFIENSKAYQELKESAREAVVQHLEKECASEINLAKARLQKEINRRLSELPEHRRQFAEKALDRIFRQFFSETQERIAVIVSVALDAFEKDAYWELFQEIDGTEPGDIEELARALERFGLLDMAGMMEQARHRVQFLDSFEGLISDPKTKESAVHGVVESNFWLLGRQFSFVASNQTLHKIVDEYLNKKYKGEKADNRPDLLLADSLRGEHLLIEFKRPSHSLDRKDEAQAQEYRDELSQQLSGKISVLLLGGRRSQRIATQNDNPSIEWKSYKQLISDSRLELKWLLGDLVRSADGLALHSNSRRTRSARR